MACPLCESRGLPDDFSLVEWRGKRVTIEGRLETPIRPGQGYYPPLPSYLVVPLSPAKGKVKYIKLKNWEELAASNLDGHIYVRVDGCLHEAYGEEFLFDVTRVVTVQDG